MTQSLDMWDVITDVDKHVRRRSRMGGYLPEADIDFDRKVRQAVDNLAISLSAVGLEANRIGAEGLTVGGYTVQKWAPFDVSRVFAIMRQSEKAIEGK